MVTIISETLPRKITLCEEALKVVKESLRVNVGDVVFVKKRLGYGVRAEVYDITVTPELPGKKVLHLHRAF